MGKDKEKKERKPFKETKFGQILGKVKSAAPHVLGIAAKVATGNISGAIDQAKEVLMNDPSPEAKAALTELQTKMAEIHLELEKVELEEFRIETADRQDARKMRTALAQAGTFDLLYYVSGFVALASFGFMVYTGVMHKELFENNPVANQLFGMVAGVALTLFAFFFGSSKSSGEKTKLMALNKSDN